MLEQYCKRLDLFLVHCRFDVALLRLHRPVRFKANILPICLPQDEKSYEGRVGVVAGWGKTDTSFGMISHRQPV